MTTNPARAAGPSLPGTDRDEQSSGDATSQASPARAWFFVIVLSLAGIVSVLDRTILNIVVDPVRTDLGLTEIQIGLLQGLAFGLFYATVGLPLGLGADRFSRRKIVMAGIVVWSVATVAAGFAESFTSLFVTRLLVGLGEAALSPATISLIADLFPPASRGKPISVLLLGQAAAAGLGISIVGLMTDAAGAGYLAGVPVLGTLAPWRVAFVCCGLLGFVVVAALLPTREPARRGAVIHRDLAVQAKASATYLLLRARLFVPLYLGFALYFLASYGAAAWSPTMLMRAFELSRSDLAASLGPLTLLCSLAGPVIGGVVVDAAMRRGRGLARFTILVVVPLLAIPSALAVLAPSAGSATALVAYGPAVSAVVGTTTLALLQSMVPPESRGFAVALTGLVNTLLGATLGPLLISVLTERVFAQPLLVGWSIAAVLTPALIAASALNFQARRSVLHSISVGTVPGMASREIA